MKSARDPDTTIGAWLEDGPTELADPVRRLIGTAARTTPQRRRIGAPWRSFDMNSAFKFAVGAAAVVAIAVLGIFLLRPTPSLDVGGEAPTPSPTPVGESGSALEFDRPFDYVLPAGSRLELVDASADWYNFEVGGGSGDDPGVAVRLIASVNINPCSPAEGIRQLESGPDGLIEYLRSVPGITVTDPIETSIDGRAALSVDVVAQPEGACPEISLWPNAPLPFTTMVAPGRRTRMIATDVDNATIVVVIWAPDLAAWLPTATAFVESFQFR